MLFPINVSLEPSLYLQPFSRYLHPNISGFTTLTSQGQVTSPVTWQFDSPGAVSYSYSTNKINIDIIASYNRVCVCLCWREWEKTNACYQRLIQRCHGDENALHELRIHVGRYVIYSLPCRDPSLRCNYPAPAVYFTSLVHCNVFNLMVARRAVIRITCTSVI